MSTATPIRRQCWKCKRRIISRKDAADAKKTFTEPVVTPHCKSPTCTWCQPCHTDKRVESGLAP